MFLKHIEPDDRIVIVVVDLAGNKGKSRFTKHLMLTHGALLGVAENKQATSYLYTGQPICLFDVERASAFKIDWSLIEALKDGMIINTKYECAVKTAMHANGTSHVLIFMNAYPNFAKLSLDRWQTFALLVAWACGPSAREVLRRLAFSPPSFFFLWPGPVVPLPLVLKATGSSPGSPFFPGLVLWSFGRFSWL